MRQIKFILFIFLPVFLILSPSYSFSQIRPIEHHHSFYRNISDSSKITSDKNYSDIPGYKSPYIAGIMSFIGPGLGFGQLYNQQPVEALFHIVISIGSICTAALLKGSGHPDLGGFFIGGGIFALNWIWSISDAVISSIVINKELEYKRNLELLKNRIPDTSNIGREIKNVKFIPQRSPFVAGLSSFIMPGLGVGQLYNKQPTKAFIHIGITAVALGIALGVQPEKNRYIGIVAGSGILLLNWIWSIGDAIVSAVVINNEIDYKRKENKLMKKK